jgi:hypothetical protein
MIPTVSSGLSLWLKRLCWLIGKAILFYLRIGAPGQNIYGVQIFVSLYEFGELEHELKIFVLDELL